jgi:DNA polymerase III subunit delta'
VSASFRTLGHAAALRAVRRAVLEERPPHALLLSGPPRVGKTTLAEDLTAGLLCLAEDPSARPCRACAACRKLDAGNHPDVHRLAPEGAGQQIRLGQVQALATQLALLPLEGRFRVAIVEQAQRLNHDAQNALLKTLEEPPAGAVIILAADEPSGLLPTVASRCARLRLGPVAPAAIAELLAEKHGLDALRGEALGRQSGGIVGLALDMAAQPELLLARERLARALLDLLGADRRTRLAAAQLLLADATELVAGAGAAEEAVVEGAAARPNRSGRGAPAEKRAAVLALLGVWREMARDLALAARGGSGELRQREMLDEIAGMRGRLDAERSARFIERLDGMSRAVDAYANPELVLDALLIEWTTVALAPASNPAPSSAA